MARTATAKKTTTKAGKKAPPWKKGNPRRTHAKLSPSQKAAAKRAAQKAGRPYPNLVDNMRVARRRKSKAS